MILELSQGNMTLIVNVDEKGRAYLEQFCHGTPTEVRVKKPRWAPLCEVHVTGENADDHHGAKHTGSFGSYALRYADHRIEDTQNGKRVAVFLTNERMRVVVYYQLFNGIDALLAWTTVENAGTEPLGLEYVSSFAYTGLDDADLPALQQRISVGIPHNGTVREGNWRWSGLSALGLERISSSSTKRLSVSNTGTWSAKEFLPMGALQNADSRHCYLWQIEHSGSWQWELGEIDKMLYLKVSGPTEQENGWYRELAVGERFESVKVAVAVAPDFDAAVTEMTKYRRTVFQNSAQNRKMPVIFNDYMNCLMGDPTEQRELPMIARAAAAGAEYYCIDAGWYADGNWWDTVGEWQPYAGRFPNGLRHLFDCIRQQGMIPGIWLELEVMGINCPLAREWEDDCFFLRHGKRIIDHGRYQLDFRHPKVRAHATAIIDRVVQEYGVGYIKMDYNIEVGLGTERDADSFGDGLLRHNRAYLSWLDETLARYPDLIWENCSSGGMRMDYAMLRRAHLQSVTDQMSYQKMPAIAVAAPTAVLPEQSAIWSYPLADADEDAVVCNMINAMLQRIHLSGKLTELSDVAFAAVKRGVDVYKSYRDLLMAAQPFWPLGVTAQGSPWHALGMKCADRSLVAVWRMDTDDSHVTLPVKGYARVLYSAQNSVTVRCFDDSIRVELPRRHTAVLLEIQ